MSEIIQKVTREAGGIVALARELGIRHNSIYSWTEVPSKRVRDVERITGIPRQELRPDLYKAETGDAA